MLIYLAQLLKFSQYMHVSKGKNMFYLNNVSEEK